jgi:hypothetical protein
MARKRRKNLFMGHKSTFINALKGNCILPFKNEETTQAIVQL